VAWNRPKSATEIAAVVRDSLAARLPDSWKLVDRRGKSSRSDIVVELSAPDGTRASVWIEAKGRLEPRDVPRLLDEFGTGGKDALLIASVFLTPRTREILANRGAGYADVTGNFRLVLSKPALFIETKGADRDPWPDKKPLKSLKGRAAGRLVRALCDLDPPFAVRELAARAGVSPASASRVLALLDRDALIQREKGDVVNRVQKADLIRRWVRDYSLLQSNITDSFLEPRGVPTLLTKLKSAKFKYAVTGAYAASCISPAAPPRTVTIYVENMPKAAVAMDLRRAETGTNVILVEPFDKVVFERTSTENEIRCVALSQLCADLLSGPGRDPAEGEELLGKLVNSESKPLAGTQAVAGDES
jgi:hypothetical protein